MVEIDANLLGRKQPLNRGDERRQLCGELGVPLRCHHEREEFLPDQIVQRVLRPELLTDVFSGRALFDPDLVKFHRRMAHQRILSLRIQRTETRPVGSRRAMSSESQSCPMAPSRAGPAHRCHLKHNAAKTATLWFKSHIGTRKEWAGPGGTIIRTIFKQYTGGATKRKDQPEWT